MPGPKVEEDFGEKSTSYQRALDAKQFRDPLLGIRPAGTSTLMFEDTVGRDLASDIYFKRPDTPPEQRKFRKNIVPGEICVHHGLMDQPLPDPEFAFGIHSDKGETVARTFTAGQKFGVAAVNNDFAESVYISNKREPLGKGYSRGHELPAVTKEESFPGFGMKSKDVADGKLVVFPRGVQPDTEEMRKQYLKSHGNYLPGEMYVRKYNWPAEAKDPDFRFGAIDKSSAKGEAGGVKGAFNFECNDKGLYPETRIGRTTLEDYRNVHHNDLGKPRNYCQGKPKVPEGHAFGIVSAGANDTAAACLKGCYTVEEQLPEKDLGRCLIPGKRNIAPKGRAFGCPSVRVDIPAPDPNKRSVADGQNYGDEIGAAAVLNPQRFEMLGVPDKEFLLRREKEEIEEILKGSGYNSFFVEGERLFDKLWDKALSLFDDELALASLDSILYVYGMHLEGKIAEKF